MTCLLEGSGVALVATSMKCIYLCILKKCISINNVLNYTMCFLFCCFFFSNSVNTVMHLHPCKVQRIAWKPDAVLFVMQCSRVKSLLLWGCCLSRRDVLTRSRITTWLPRRISVWSVEKQILTSGLTHLFTLQLIYIESLLRTCSACLISSTEPIKQICLTNGSLFWTSEDHLPC